MLHRWLANPWVLWLLTALPIMAGFAAVAWWQRRRARALLGSSCQTTASGRGRRIVQGTFFTVGLALLVVASAGPQWGQRPVRAEDLATGRDLVVVLDLSRSMLAEQPSRLELALAGLKDLANALEAHGGHRIALVTFATHARLVFPLTIDYDHFRDALEQQDADHLLPALRSHKGEAAKSGTRIGEALRTAVAAHDPNCKGAQDILLISDGDDPAGDEEWADGAEAARSHAIPVDAIGVGDPDTPSSIPTKNGPLQYNGAIVMTRLEEKPLQEIARRTHGLYVAARTSAVPIGKWVRSAMEARGVRRPSDAMSVAALPLYRPRFPWFFGAALACLTVSLLVTQVFGFRFSVFGHGITDRLLRKPKTEDRKRNVWPIPLLLVLLSAGPSRHWEDQIRQGNAAFTEANYDKALQLYQQAEERATDPGLVAFNEGAALYRAGRFHEAGLHYRRALEGAPAPREAMALYNLGNCLLRETSGSDAKKYAEAMSCYEKCLLHPDADADLRGWAARNLELARLLWQQAPKTAAEASPQNADSGGSAPPGDSRDRNGAPGDLGASERASDGKVKAAGRTEQANPKNAIETNEETPGKGNVRPLPDRDELTPLTPEEAAAHLDQAARRITRDQSESRQGAVPSAVNVKDW